MGLGRNLNCMFWGLVMWEKGGNDKFFYGVSLFSLGTGAGGNGESPASFTGD